MAFWTLSRATVGVARETEEFAFIREVLAPLSRGMKGAGNLSDDAALLPPPPAGSVYVVSADSYAEGVHFLKDDPPHLVGGKILLAALSDLAAMGAEPRAWLFLAAWGRGWTVEKRRACAQGLAEAQKTHRLSLIGGDTIAVSGGAVFGITVFGTAKHGRILSRGAMREGDALYATGSLGDAALGLHFLRENRDEIPACRKEPLIARYRLPCPRIAMGLAAAGFAHAAIDLSDGLLADLERLCRASGVGAEIFADSLPLSDAARAVMPVKRLKRLALNAGDDYELLISAPEKRQRSLMKAARQTNTPLVKIGRALSKSESSSLSPAAIDSDGKPVRPLSEGFSHRL